MTAATWLYRDPDGDVLELVEIASGGVNLIATESPSLTEPAKTIVTVVPESIPGLIHALSRALARTNADKAVTVPDIPGHSRTGDGNG